MRLSFEMYCRSVICILIIYHTNSIVNPRKAEHFDTFRYNRTLSFIYIRPHDKIVENFFEFRTRSRVLVRDSGQLHLTSSLPNPFASNRYTYRDGDYAFLRLLPGDLLSVKDPAASYGASNLQRSRAAGYLTLAAVAKWTCKHVRLARCPRE